MEYFRTQTNLVNLIYLMSDSGFDVSTNVYFQTILDSESQLEQLTDTLAGLGPSKRSIVTVSAANSSILNPPNQLIPRIHQSALLTHA